MGLYEQFRIDDSDTGKAFGKWTQIGPSFSVWFSSRQKNRYAVCRCECGSVEAVRTNQLRGPDGNRCKKCSTTTHGLTSSCEYKVWQGMVRRCSNTNERYYHHYGGRGITVCERWRHFPNFYADMGPRPSSDHSLDRIDNDGHYEPGNCRWATRSQQQRNKRSNHHLYYEGRSILLVEAAEISGIPIHTISARLRVGWTVKEAIETPYASRRRHKRLQLNGGYGKL